MSAPEIYSDDNGQRLVYRHAGPPGRGLPPGGTTGQIYVKASNDDFDGEWANAPDGTGAAVGPSSSLNATVVLFDGTTGKLLKDSTRTINYFAARAYVDTTFVPKSGSKVLTDINFSSADKNKLDSLSVSGAFFGVFADEDALNASSDVKLPGAYAFVLDPAPTLYFWDADGELWVTTAFGGMSGEEVAAALFNSTDSATYGQSTCRIFTTALKTMLESHDSILNLAGFGSSVSYVEKTANYVITKSDRTINCTANSFILTLPTAVGDTGRTFIIKNSGSGVITINTSDGIQTIDDTTSYELTTQWESVTLQSTGNNWIII